MKKKLAAIFSFVLICAFGFTCAGCAGNDPASNTVNMYGSKVLYRPDHYDYDENSGNAGYYGQYAWQIFSTLNAFYGNVGDLYSNKDYINLLPQETNKKNYMYDSLRYQVVQEQSVNSVVKHGTSTTQTSSISRPYVHFIANIDYGWNWKFKYDTPPTAATFLSNNSVYNTEEFKHESPLISNNFYINMEEGGSSTNTYAANVSTYYHNNSAAYSTQYLGTSTQKETDDEKYSNYVKALEYVIYCMNMEIEPKAMRLNADGVVVGIETFTSIDAALEYVKNLFEQRGNYVGITENKQKRLAKYILENVIGSGATSHDQVQIQTAVRHEYYDNNDYTGTPSRVEYVVTGTQNTVNVGRNYEAVVNAVVKNVCAYVEIGSNTSSGVEDDKLHINDAFVSSAIRDYYNNYFYISADAGKEFDHIPALEYQSLCMMFSEDTTFDNIWLFFKYDSGGDGDDKVDPTASLTVRVYLRYFNYASKTVTQYGDSTITIPDGKFDYGQPTHTVNFDGFTGTRTAGVTVGAFNRDIGNGVMTTTPTSDNPLWSNEVYLNGAGRLKDYYKLISSDNEILGSTYYSYGVLNEDMFKGADGCDFFEIAFEVVKATGENDNNYKFQVGFGMIG